MMSLHDDLGPERQNSFLRDGTRRLGARLPYSMYRDGTGGSAGFHFLSLSFYFYSHQDDDLSRCLGISSFGLQPSKNS